jgi:hypothetical protein
MSLQELKRRVASGASEPDDTLVVHEQRSFRVSVADLKAAIAAHPTHPVAQVYAKAVRNLAPTHLVVVDRADVAGLLDDKEVRTIVARSGDVETWRKEVAGEPSKAESGERKADGTEPVKTDHSQLPKADGKK